LLAGSTFLVIMVVRKNILRRDVARYVSAGRVPNGGQRDVASNVSTIGPDGKLPYQGTWPRGHV
jgi:hypothetical protein